MKNNYKNIQKAPHIYKTTTERYKMITKIHKKNQKDTQNEHKRTQMITKMHQNYHTKTYTEHRDEKQTPQRNIHEETQNNNKRQKTSTQLLKNNHTKAQNDHKYSQRDAKQPHGDEKHLQSYTKITAETPQASETAALRHR